MKRLAISLILLATVATVAHARFRPFRAVKRGGGAVTRQSVRLVQRVRENRQEVRHARREYRQVNYVEVQYRRPIVRVRAPVRLVCRGGSCSIR